MEKQLEYQSLMEQILDNLAAEKADLASDNAVYQQPIEHPPVEPQSMESFPADRMGMQPFSQAGPGPDDHEPSSFLQHSGISPLPIASASEQIYDNPPITAVAPVYREPLEGRDDVPAFIHRSPHALDGTPDKSLRKTVFGLTSVALLGAMSSIYFLPDPAQTNASIDTSQVSNDVVGGETSAQLANAGAIARYGERLEGDKAADKSPPAAVNEPPQIMASANGNIDRLVGNVVRDLARVGTAAPVANLAGSPALAQSPPEADTLNKLEDSIANIDRVQAGVKQELSEKIVTAQLKKDQAAPAKKPASANDKMRLLTDQVVDALANFEASDSGAGAPLEQSVDKLRSTLSDLVQEAESQGKNASSVEVLIKEALGGKKANLPAALRNKDGSLDITTLIASVVKGAGSSGKASPEESNYLSLIQEEGGKTAIHSRLLGKKGGVQYVLVKSGDTLSSIAYAVYGDAFTYPKIFKANRKIIKNPNILIVGMRLTIPKK